MQSTELIRAMRRLAREADRLRFAPPVRFVYNPLLYAREPAERYVTLYATGRKKGRLPGHEPRPVGNGADGRPVRRGRSREGLASHQGASLGAGGGAPAGARARLRLHSERGERE